MEKMCNMEKMTKESRSDILSLKMSVIAAQPSASATNAGTILFESLAHSGEIPSFVGEGDPVISQGFRFGEKILEKEALVIQHLTPYLREAVSAHRGERNLVLLNTERHPYFESEFVVGSKKAPDMIVCHRAAVEEDKSGVDKKYDSSDKDFLFGKLANWNLRDFATCAIELKIAIGGQKKYWGEMVEYARIWVAKIHNIDAGTAPKKGYMNWLLADATCFYMIVSNEIGVIVRAKGCDWNTAGGLEVLGTFLCGGKLPDYEFHVSVSPWETALDWCLDALELTLECDSDTGMSFLGLGAIGRVFRVKTDKNEIAALKITVGWELVESLRIEIDRYALFKHEHLSKLDKSKVHPEDLYGGLVSYPVGSKPNFKLDKTIIAAKKTLESLFEKGIVHCDARCPNFLYVEVENRYFWTDLRTVRRVADENLAFDRMKDITHFELDHATRYNPEGKSG
jgi:hypothetical protein